MPRLFPLCAFLLLPLFALPACGDDPAAAPAGAAGGGAGTSAGGANGGGSAGSAAGTGGASGASGIAGASGAGGSVQPMTGGTLTATVDGKAVEVAGEAKSFLETAGSVFTMSRPGPNGDDIIRVQFTHNNGFPKPFVIPSAEVGTERQAVVGTTSVEYWASRQGSKTIEDKLALDGGRIKGTWTYTSKLWGNGSGDSHEVIITMDLPLPADLL